MITHRDEITGIAPGATAPTLAGWHVDPVKLAAIRASLAASGWRDLTVTPCRACSERVPIAA